MLSTVLDWNKVRMQSLITSSLNVYTFWVTDEEKFYEFIVRDIVLMPTSALVEREPSTLIYY